MTRRSQPPGFRFQPTHVELVLFYLKRQILQKKLPMGVISELDIYKHAPWDLPDKSCMKSGELKWYFFCPIERKYASGARIKRATKFGYWKSTGKDRPVVYNNEAVGQIKTLTFFRGKAPKGDQTDWVMHEYRIEGNNQSLKNIAQDAYVLCVIFQKDGPGPRNGAQYGAPFKEDDWDEDCLEEVDLSSGLPVVPSKEARNSFSTRPSNTFGCPSASCISENLASSSMEPPNSFSTTPNNTFGCPSASCISENLASSSMEPPQIVSESIAPVEISPTLDNVDDGFTMEDFFPDKIGNFLDGDGLQADVDASNNPDQNDTTFEGLEDLCGGWLDASNENAHAFGTGHGVIYSTAPTFPINEAMRSSDQMPAYMELNDLDAPLTSTSCEDMQISNFNSAYNCSSVIEQPRFPFSSSGVANQYVPSCYYSSLHNSNDLICQPTDLGYPDAHMSASSQFAWPQENIHPNTNGGYNGKAPWSDHHD